MPKVLHEFPGEKDEYCTRGLHHDLKKGGKIIKGYGGLSRDLNPGPRAPEARIIPLDQRATSIRLPLRTPVYIFKFP